MTPPVTQADLHERLELRAGVFCARAGDGELFLIAWPARESMGRLSRAQHALLRRLASVPGTVADLRAILRQHDDTVLDAQQLDDLLTRLRAGGWLAVTVVQDGRPLYTVAPNRRPPAPPAPAAPSDLVLSRFALLRREGDQIVLASPVAWCEVRIHHPDVLALLSGLVPTPGAVTAPHRLPDAVTDRLRRDLWWAGLAVTQPSAEDAELARRQWAPHELWFHDQSRLGHRRPNGYGGTWWARGSFDPLPARHARFPGPTIELYQPDLERLRTADPRLTAVLENRRSIRRHDDAHPLRVDQLGEFLYRCAGNRGMATAEGVEYVSRPYPSGGGSHELELYPVIRHVAGLEPGMYHYDPQVHRLEPVRGPSPAVRRLLASAASSAATSSQPQVLLVVAARFGRVMWKYQGMPYALTLKHVGVLYQVMYLVATAMGLAPCALGGGDSSAFTEATGLDPLAESSVGEFLLGSRPATRSISQGAS